MILPVEALKSSPRFERLSQTISMRPPSEPARMVTNSFGHGDERGGTDRADVVVHVAEPFHDGADDPVDHLAVLEKQVFPYGHNVP